MATGLWNDTSDEWIFRDNVSGDWTLEIPMTIGLSNDASDNWILRIPITIGF